MEKYTVKIVDGKTLDLVGGNIEIDMDFRQALELSINLINSITENEMLVIEFNGNSLVYSGKKVVD